MKLSLLRDDSFVIQLDVNDFVVIDDFENRKPILFEKLKGISSTNKLI